VRLILRTRVAKDLHSDKRKVVDVVKQGPIEQRDLPLRSRVTSELKLEDKDLLASVNEEIGLRETVAR
jgi:hypothetical protein